MKTRSDEIQNKNSIMVEHWRGLKILKSKSLIICKQRSRELTTRWSVYGIVGIPYRNDIILYLTSRTSWVMSWNRVLSSNTIQLMSWHDVTTFVFVTRMPNFISSLAVTIICLQTLEISAQNVCWFLSSKKTAGEHLYPRCSSLSRSFW